MAGYVHLREKTATCPPPVTRESIWEYASYVTAAASSATPSNPGFAPLIAQGEMTRQPLAKDVDVYFSADVETDGPIPGPYSMLSFALVEAGTFDGKKYDRSPEIGDHFYAELKPISDAFQPEALVVNKLDRERLFREGREPVEVMTAAAEWIQQRSRGGSPVLVAYPLVFDWTWLYWYFIRFCRSGSPFNHSRCYDIKTALSVKGQRQVVTSGRDYLPTALIPNISHTHNALDDAREQADIFANLFEWHGE